jgi:hypothetical protein
MATPRGLLPERKLALAVRQPRFAIEHGNATPLEPMDRRTFTLAIGTSLLLAASPIASFGQAPRATKGLSPEDGRLDAMLERFCQECSARSGRAADPRSPPAVRFATQVQAGLVGEGRAESGRMRAYLGRLRSVDRSLLSRGRKHDFDDTKRALLDRLSARTPVGGLPARDEPGAALLSGSWRNPT